MWNDFKKFALKGNVVDMAVGVIIGGAFGKIVTSLVNDLIMPLVGLLTGGINYSHLVLILGSVPEGAVITTLEDAKALNVPTLNYGAFLTELLDFLIMAFSIFLFIRLLTKLSELNPLKKKKAGEAPAPTTKTCPFCLSEIDIRASRCPHCTSVLEGPAPEKEGAETPAGAQG